MKSYVESGGTMPVSCADVADIWFKWVMSHTGRDYTVYYLYGFFLQDASETALCAKII